MVLAYLLKENLKRTVEFTQVILDAFDVARPVVTDYGREVLDEYDDAGREVRSSLLDRGLYYGGIPLDKIVKYSLDDLEKNISRGLDSELIKDYFYHHEIVRDALSPYSDLKIYEDKEFCESWGEPCSEELDKRYSELRNKFYSSLK